MTTTDADPTEGRMSGTLPQRVYMATPGPAHQPPRPDLPSKTLSRAAKHELARRVLEGLRRA